MPFPPLLVLLLLLLSLLPPSSPKSPAIGVSFNTKTSGDLPPSDSLVSALRSAGVRRLLVHDPEPSLLSSLQYADISVTLSLPAFASYGNYTEYLLSNVLPFHPRLHISAILLGRDPAPHDLVPAIAAFRSSLSALGLPLFPISTILSFSKALDPALPPSAARFKPHLLPLLKTLGSVGSPIYIDLFPFGLYPESHTLPIGFAMFERCDFSYRLDPGSALQYRNLFDMMADATFTALEAAEHRRTAVVVAGSGWPTGGAGGGKEATVGYAGRYNRGLVKHLRSGIGTPMRSNGVDEVYVHQLFDDDHDEGLGPDHLDLDWGVWYKNLSAKYDLDLSGWFGGGRDAMQAMLTAGFFWALLILVVA